MSMLSRIIAAICGEPRSQPSPPAAPNSKATEAVRPRRRHRRLSNVRRLLRALGLMGVAIAVTPLVRGQAPDPATQWKFLSDLVAAAVERTHHAVTYDPGYVAIDYPNGDVPAGSGVCSDEIVRAYRALGIDLQKEVHEDIVKGTSAYPLSRWKQTHADRNIDHRRVPNLMVFFSRHGEELPITDRSQDYRPGDLVAWTWATGTCTSGWWSTRRASSAGVT